MEGKTRIRILFYKAKFPDGHIIDDGISLWTGFLALISFGWNRLKYNYSHVEVWLPDEDGRFFGCGHRRGGAASISSNDDETFSATVNLPLYELEYYGQCFSSTTRGKWNGVRFAPASQVLTHPDRWDYIECEVDKDGLELALELARIQVGKAYDYKGIIPGFFWPWNIHNKNKWYCSELCSWFANICDLTEKWHERISPRKLAHVLVRDTRGKMVKL